VWDVAPACQPAQPFVVWRHDLHRPRASACHFQTPPCLSNCFDLARRSPKRLSKHSVRQQRATVSAMWGCCCCATPAGLPPAWWSWARPTKLVGWLLIGCPYIFLRGPWSSLLAPDGCLTDCPMHALCLWWMAPLAVKTHRGWCCHCTVLMLCL
jgi:hypothetical protein